MNKESLPKVIKHKEPGMFYYYDLVPGVDEYAEFGIVARGYIEAEGRGREALTKLHNRLEEIANRFGVVICHLEEGDTGPGKLFLRRIRNEGKILQDEVWIRRERFFVERFEPKSIRR